MSVITSAEALAHSHTPELQALAETLRGKQQADFFSDSTTDRLAMAHDASH